MKETAIYIHIPFCDHKCIYCDFYSIISYENITSYLSALKKEINYFAEKFSDDRKIISIFFGGGTPSFMEPAYIGEILGEIKKSFNVSDEAEITLETNPGTVDKAKLEAFRKIGINRLSIGIQSFDVKELKFLTRIHDAETAKQTMMSAKEAGFENISIDLIFNLPGQTRKTWNSNLEQALSLPITHLSAYSLILESGTILNKMVLDGKVVMQDEDYDADLYESTIDYLTAKGFIQYEVSNFAKPGLECVHNNAYWRYKDYIGLGTSAHSFVNGKRWWNYSGLTFYLNSVDKKNHGIAGEEVLSEKQKQDEYVMLALRSKGLDLKELSEKFDAGWIEKNSELISDLILNGFMIKQDDFIFFTPKGYSVCDEILRKLD